MGQTSAIHFLLAQIASGEHCKTIDDARVLAGTALALLEGEPEEEKPKKEPKKRNGQSQVPGLAAKTITAALENASPLGFDVDEIYEEILKLNLPMPRDRDLAIRRISRRLSQNSGDYRKLDNGKWVLRKKVVPLAV